MDNAKSSEHQQAKAYQRTKNWLTLVSIGLVLFLFLVIFKFDLGHYFLFPASAVTNPYGKLAVFFFVFSVYFFIFQIPLSFYSGFTLEHRYQLSNQTLKAWILDLIKKEALSFIFSALLVIGLFALIWNFPERWWLWSWLAYGFVSVVMGKLFPVFIIPLFYKYSPIPDGELKARILSLADRSGISIRHICSLNLSKTTKKANAAFCGFGKTKRVILGDTLIENFSVDEIEMVLAHEIGHFKNKDIWKQLALGMAVSFVSFWGVFMILKNTVASFGYQSAQDILVFPFLCFLLFVFAIVLGPLGNAYSRFIERKADQFALTALPKAQVFISMMEKLGRNNLADPNPHPLIEFLLYDHPSLQKRIEFAKKNS